MSKSKYKVTVKIAGWEKEEVPDQLFIPRADSVKKKPEQLEFDPSRFKPVKRFLRLPRPTPIPIFITTFNCSHHTLEN